MKAGLAEVRGQAVQPGPEIPARPARRRRDSRNSGRTIATCFVDVPLRFAPIAAGLLALAALRAPAQERRPLAHRRGAVHHRSRGHAQHLNPSPPRPPCGSLRWTTTSTRASFELNNALNVSRVVDGQGKQIPASRNQQDFTVRLSFDQPLPKGQPVTITFYYDGRLPGRRIRRSTASSSPPSIPITPT